MVNPQLDISFRDIAATSYLLHDQIINTQCLKSRLTNHFKCKSLYLKLEYKQNGGSYKSRGAFNVLMNLSSEDQKRGVVTASQGNHGVALSYAAKTLGVPITIVFPKQSPTSKIQICRKNGAEFFVDGADLWESHAIAANIAKKANKKFIDVFTNFAIGAGNSTVGLEMAQQVPHMDYCIIPISSEKGILRGMKVAIKKLCPKCKIYAVRGPFRDQSRLTTSSDPFVDRIIEVSDDDVLTAFLLLVEVEKILVEPSSAMALAAITSRKYPEFVGQNVVVLLGNGNVDLAAVSKLLQNSKAVPMNKISFTVFLPDEIGSLQKLCTNVAKQQVSISDMVFPKSRDEPMIVFCETSGPEHSKIFIRNMLAVYPDFQVIPAKTKYPQDRAAETQPFFMKNQDGRSSQRNEYIKSEVYEHNDRLDPSEMDECMAEADYQLNHVPQLPLVQKRAPYPSQIRPYNTDIPLRYDRESQTKPYSMHVQEHDKASQPYVFQNPESSDKMSYDLDEEQGHVSPEKFQANQVGVLDHGYDQDQHMFQYDQYGSGQKFALETYARHTDRMGSLRVDHEQHLSTLVGKIDTGDTSSVGRVDHYRKRTKVTLVGGGIGGGQKFKDSRFCSDHQAGRSVEEEVSANLPSSHRTCKGGCSKYSEKCLCQSDGVENKFNNKESQTPLTREITRSSEINRSRSKRDHSRILAASNGKDPRRILSEIKSQNGSGPTLDCRPSTYAPSYRCSSSLYEYGKSNNKLTQTPLTRGNTYSSELSQSRSRRNRSRASAIGSGGEIQPNLDGSRPMFDSCRPGTCPFPPSKSAQSDVDDNRIDSRRDRYCKCGLKITGCTGNTCKAYLNISKDSEKSRKTPKSQKSLRSSALATLEQSETLQPSKSKDAVDASSCTSSCTTSTSSTISTGGNTARTANISSTSNKSQDKSARLDAGANDIDFQLHALNYEDCHCSKSLVCNFCYCPIDSSSLALVESSALSFSETLHYDLNFEAELSNRF